MKNNNLLFGIFIASIFVTVFGGGAFATSGNAAELAGGKNWEICVATGGASGDELFVADITGPEFDTQLFYDNTDDLSCKTIALGDGNYVAHLYNSISTKNIEHTIDGARLTFAVEGASNQYLRVSSYLVQSIASSEVQPTSFPKVFSLPGVCRINGGTANISGETCIGTIEGETVDFTNNLYIDTGVKLFSEENNDKDFEVYFELGPDASASGQVVQATLMNSMYEDSGMNYPGLLFRVNGSSNYQLLTNYGRASMSKTIPSNTAQSVRILRIDGVLYYSINGAALAALQDFSGFDLYFDETVWFGASSNKGTPWRYFKGSLQNMYVKLGTYDGDSYNLSFSANGGSGAMDPYIAVMANTQFTLPYNTFTYDGYIFNGWNTEADGSGEWFADGADVNFDQNGNIVLYAQWTDEADFSDGLPEVFGIGGECVVNSGNAVTGENCKGVVNGREIDFTNYSYIDSGIKLFDQQNSSKSFEIYFELGDDTATARQADMATFMNAMYEDSAAKYPGVVFRAKSKPEFSILANHDSRKNELSAGTAVYSVKIVRHNDVVYYSINGGPMKYLMDFKNFSSFFDETVWFGASSNKGTPWRFVSGTIKNIYIRLGEYQESTSTKYSVTFSPNGGTLSETVRVVRDGVAVGILPIPSREGWKFVGWNSEPDGSGEVWTMNTTVTGDAEIYAQWEALATYKVRFDANGGTGSMSDVTATEDVPVALPENSFTSASGNIFIGWNTNANGSGDSYDNGAFITITSQMVDNDGNYTLYAQWAEDKAVLDRGANVNARLNALAEDMSKIKAIKKASRLSAGFDTNDEANIISSQDSPRPIYAWFDDIDSDDDGDGDGIIYVYSDATRISSGSDMSQMFYYAKSLTDISDLADWDTSSATNMSSIFESASSLSDISALASWNTSSVTNMSSMFYYARSLTDISALANWNTSSATNMSKMFGATAGLADTSALRTMQYEGKDYISWDVSKVANMSDMFSSDASLVDLSGLSSWDTSSVTNMGGMFEGASSLVDISALANWDTSSVVIMDDIFCEASSLSDISALATWNTSSVKYLTRTLSKTKITNTNALRTMQHEGKDYVSWDVSKVECLGGMFSSARSLTDISALATWDTASVTDMNAMFDGVALLSDISALANWNTSNVTTIDGIFRFATSLSDISALANWDTSNVTNMCAVFYSTALSDISALATWNTSKVENMMGMFGETRITNVDALRTVRHEGKNYVSWNVSKVTDMSSMFRRTSYLRDVSALSSWNTSSVTNMMEMFISAKRLSDVSALFSWNTSNVEYMQFMFSGISATSLPAWYHE